MGWFYGFKLHLVVNDEGELLAFCLTPGNIDDRRPAPGLTKALFGQLFGCLFGSFFGRLLLLRHCFFQFADPSSKLLVFRNDLLHHAFESFYFLRRCPLLSPGS